jgi:hypothetical protein
MDKFVPTVVLMMMVVVYKCLSMVINGYWWWWWCWWCWCWCWWKLDLSILHWIIRYDDMILQYGRWWRWRKSWWMTCCLLDQILIWNPPGRKTWLILRAPHSYRMWRNTLRGALITSHAGNPVDPMSSSPVPVPFLSLENWGYGPCGSQQPFQPHGPLSPEPWWQVLSFWRRRIEDFQV